MQTLDPALYEVIVTDDGSPVSTEKAIKSKYPWARYLHGPRRGPAANRNCGARAARSPFIAFVDDDCIPTSQWLAEFYRVITDSIDVYEGKTTCNEGIDSPLQQAPINLEGGNFWSCNLMVRASTFWGHGGFDEAFPYAAMEDIAFRDTLMKLQIRHTFVPDASINHPPRLTPTGWKLSSIHESFAIFWSKFPQHARSTRQHMSAIWKLRLKTIFKNRWSRHSVRAFMSAISEQSLILCKMPHWKRRYSPQPLQYKQVRKPLK